MKQKTVQCLFNPEKDSILNIGKSNVKFHDILHSTMIKSMRMSSLFFLIALLYVKFSFADQQITNVKLQVQDGCIAVPENYSIPNGVSISLCYHWLDKYDSSKQTFIFLVGGPGAGSEYYLKFSKFWMTTKLGQQYNILFFDPRGVAKSSEITSNNINLHDLYQYTLSNMTSDIESLRKELLGNQPIGLIGHSTGGHQVFDYALNFSDHVFKIISLHGGASGLGFLTQVNYRLIEWQKASEGIETTKLNQLQKIIQSGFACDQDGSRIPAMTWNTFQSFALYGTVEQRMQLPGILKSLIQGNIDSKIFCNSQINTLIKQIPQIPANDPLNAMTTVNLITYIPHFDAVNLPDQIFHW